MRIPRKNRLFGWIGIAYFLAAMLAGCGGGTSTPPPQVSVTFSGGNSQTIGQGQIITITATIANDPSAKGVSWAFAGPGSLSKQTSTSVEYDAPASVVTNGSVTITATAVADTTRSAVYTVNLATIVVSVSPDNVSVVANSVQTFTATVQNDASNSGVTWTISPASGAGTLSGATKTSVTYNAPASPPSNDLAVTITATSAATPTQSVSANVVVPAIMISVDPNGAIVVAGTKQVLTATVTNDPGNAGVVWSISPAPGAGTLSDVTKTSVTFNAPATTPPSDVVVTITATSVTDATKTFPVTVTIPAIAVSISPNSPVLVPANTTQDFTATVSYDPGNAGVTWSLSPATGVGSISKATNTSVTYSAPAESPASNLTATLTATSVTDTSKSSSVQITIPAISVQVVPTSALMPVNATQQFTGNVNYDPAGKGVTWAPVQGGASCAPVCGTFSPASADSGVATTYTAPPAVPTVAGVDLTATSISDTSKSGIATITLTNGTVKLVPAKLEYGHVKYRNPRTNQLLSKSLLLTLTNEGSSALNISGMVTTTHFSQTNDCGASVAAGISCTVTVKFTPGAIGTFTGTLAINDSSPDSPQVVPLSGQGVAIFGASVPAAIAAEQAVAAPAPTGPNRVGTRTAHFVDSTREDPFAGNGTKRELMVRFWYPTGTSDCKPADYTTPAVWSYFSQLMGVPLPEVKTNSCEDAIVANGAHPVVVFTPGYTGTFTDYTFLFEDLASRGYLVAALNHTNEATVTEFPDGRMVESIFGSHLGMRLRTDEEAYTSSVIARLGDLKSVLKELDRLNGTPKGAFAGRLDMSRVALAGHSLGGLTALLGVEREIRFRAGISIDAASPERAAKVTKTPILLVMTGTGQWSVEECTLWSNLRGPRLALKLPDVEHLAPSDAIWLARGAIKTGKMSPEKMMDILRNYIATFLDAHLRGQPSDALLSGQSPDFADVVATTQTQVPCGKP
jgi:predicted dienelactone hydrolase